MKSNIISIRVILRDQNNRQNAWTSICESVIGNEGQLTLEEDKATFGDQKGRLVRQNNYGDYRYRPPGIFCGFGHISVLATYEIVTEEGACYRIITDEPSPNFTFRQKNHPDEQENLAEFFQQVIEKVKSLGVGKDEWFDDWKYGDRSW
jgi:hypothetical protein